LQIIKNTKYAGYPLCNLDKDDILGIISLKDIYDYLIENKEEKINFLNLAKEPLLLSKNTKLNEALYRMQNKKCDVAIIVDEYGGTAGMVTFKDVVKTIFNNKIKSKLSS